MIPSTAVMAEIKCNLKISLPNVKETMIFEMVLLVYANNTASSTCLDEMSPLLNILATEDILAWASVNPASALVMSTPADPNHAYKADDTKFSPVTRMVKPIDDFKSKALPCISFDSI